MKHHQWRSRRLGLHQCSPLLSRSQPDSFWNSSYLNTSRPQLFPNSQQLCWCETIGMKRSPQCGCEI
ncbi:hypothetical protein BpHYR1_049453 [Brachionus plicatilis]|uniref:Uncharacterized protein n=1 Tax=Brachionus plicatilis TaxID=10195 RepID=A0A3M7SBI1_BRAPC|nr:hypothetical protein BpHYR1_049453 [Brachionus plicatilis]